MIRKAASPPAAPISHQGWRRGASSRSVLTASLRARRPSICSEIITGNPTSTVQTRYTITNAAPPFCPVMPGNFQIFPRPTAEPMVAARTPSPVANASRFRGPCAASDAVAGRLSLAVSIMTPQPVSGRIAWMPRLSLGAPGTGQLWRTDSSSQPGVTAPANRQKETPNRSGGESRRSGLYQRLVVLTKVLLWVTAGKSSLGAYHNAALAACQYDLSPIVSFDERKRVSSSSASPAILKQSNTGSVGRSGRGVGAVPV